MIILAALAAALVLAAGPAGAEHWSQDNWDVMTTRATLSCRVQDDTQARAAVAAVRAEFERIEALLSPWRDDSELSRINREAPRGPVATTPEVFSLFTASDHFHALSGGAFDPAFAAAGHLYDYRAGIAPDAGALAAVQPALGWDRLELDPAAHSIRYRLPQVRVDFGGIAKGYAIDRAVALLRAQGLRDCHVALGGDGFAMGNHDGRPWMIGIRHPRGDADQAVVRLPVSDLAVSTSGDYERFFIAADGSRVHHILSPQTGRSARSGLVSATVIATDSLTADALSTTLFVLGLPRALALANSLPGVSAVLIDDTGKVHYSEDLAPP